MQRLKVYSLYKLVLIIIGFSIVVPACKPTRLLTDDQYLLVSNKIKLDENDIDKREMDSYLRQKPNRKTLFIFHFNLATYNFSKRGKERKWKNWMGRVIGEEPAVFDSALMHRTTNQFQRFLYNEAYYNATIDEEVKLKSNRKKAKVTYQITLGKPVSIGNVFYNVIDTSITKYIVADTTSSLLKNGERMSLKLLENERERLVSLMRDSGFYEFNFDRVRYVVDTQNYLANIQIDIDYALKPGLGSEVYKVPHQKFWINKVFIYPDFDTQQNLRNRQSYIQTFDTINREGYYLIYPGKINVKPKTILKTNLIEPNSLYNRSTLQKTDRHINSLKLFRLNNITFQKQDNSDSLLNCNIQLTPSTYQSYSVNLETTNTQGNIGLGGYINYKHRNLFHGAEILNIKLSGAYERQGAYEERAARNIWEVGAQVRLETPAFILPFRMERFYNNYHPKTSFMIDYNRQQKPKEYTRNLFTVNMGYNWHSHNEMRHYLFPIDLGVVTLPEIDSSFREQIRGTHLENSFDEYFILGPRYFLTKSNANLKRFNNYSYFRWGVQAAGNLAYALHSNTEFRDTVDGGYYTFMNTQYAQFFKTDIDYRFYNYLSPQNHLVYRLFAGVVVPYGNADGVPFVRQYFGGGPDGMRAWLARDLGPGTYNDSLVSEFYPNMYGDIKLEANLEYRFDITRSLKGAYFVDAGNIWTIIEENERPGGVFRFDSFYKQLAIGTGLGIRYDLGFTVIRLDAAVKVRDPSFQNELRWPLFNTPLKWSDIQWNFGIGYPF